MLRDERTRQLLLPGWTKGARDDKVSDALGRFRRRHLSRMKIFRAWVLPIVTMTAFFSFLLMALPYATGYGWSKVSLGMLIRGMWTIPGWDHAPLVPFICLFLVALRWKQLAREPAQGSNWGLAWIALGVFVYWLGIKAETEYFGFAALQILLAGLIVWFWGEKVFWRVSFAWLFLFFAWPLPFLDSGLGVPLRMEMSHASSALLNLFGTPTVQSGTAVLSAPDAAAGLELGTKFHIDIGDPCSGLYSLFALMMMSALAGYLAVSHPLGRLIVFLASMPVAIAGNVVRILLLVWATEHFGPAVLGTEDNPSFLHLACGYAVYLVGLLLMLGLIALLNSKTVKTRLDSWYGPRGFHPAQTESPPIAHPAD
jgi:exosortase